MARIGWKMHFDKNNSRLIINQKTYRERKGNKRGYQCLKLNTFEKLICTIRSQSISLKILRERAFLFKWFERHFYLFSSPFKRESAA